MQKITTIVVLLFILTACYEPNEACLDRTATNFDLSADEACLDCCTYPKLKIRFDNKWQTPDTLLPFRTDTFYIDDEGQPFRIERIRFYWSNYRLEMDGTQLPVTDLVRVRIPEGNDTTTLDVVDHFLLANINSARSNLTLGALKPKGVMLGLSTDFGITQPVNSALSDEIPDTHPLGPQLGNMNYGSELGYVFAKIELYRDTIASDTIPLIVNIYGDDALRSLFLPLPVPIILVEGFNPLLLVEIDFSQWFNGLDIRSDTTILQTKILENIAESFTLKGVLAN